MATDDIPRQLELYFGAIFALWQRSRAAGKEEAFGRLIRSQREAFHEAVRRVEEFAPGSSDSIGRPLAVYLVRDEGVRPVGAFLCLESARAEAKKLHKTEESVFIDRFVLGEMRDGDVSEEVS